MKTVIEKQHKIPFKSRTFRIQEPLLQRYELYCRERGGASNVINQILERWLDEHDRCNGNKA